MSPDGQTKLMQPQTDAALIKALARGYRWKPLLERSQYANQHEIAAAEKINRSFVSRTLRLTLLAPDIIAAIPDGCQNNDLLTAKLGQPLHRADPNATRSIFRRI
jgi:hypothetical protein